VYFVEAMTMRVARSFGADGLGERGGAQVEPNRDIKVDTN